MVLGALSIYEVWGGAVAEVFIPLNASGDVDEGRVGAMLDFLLRRGVEVSTLVGLAPRHSPSPPRRGLVF